MREREGGRESRGGEEEVANKCRRWRWWGRAGGGGGVGAMHGTGGVGGGRSALRVVVGLRCAALEKTHVRVRDLLYL